MYHSIPSVAIESIVPVGRYADRRDATRRTLIGRNNVGKAKAGEKGQREEDHFERSHLWGWLATLGLTSIELFAKILSGKVRLQLRFGRQKPQAVKQHTF